MVTGLAIIFLLLAIGVCVSYGTYCVRGKKILEETVERVIQFEIYFDTLKHTEASIRREMGVYETSVSKSNYEVYATMLLDINTAMRVNVKERSTLLINISKFKIYAIPDRLQYRIIRCTTRRDGDELRCNAVSTYVKRMVERPRSNFHGLKALGVELKQMDKKLPNTN